MLDPRFVLLQPLQEQLWDKDLNAPLSGGVVTFYEDNSRTVLKPIYTLSGNGPYSDASYIKLPNPIVLSAIGTFIDNNGNDIVPYLFPYDGTINPLTTTNTVDLYYITVYSAQGVLQFTRQAWPNTTTQGLNMNELTNFIPNGQFLLHNNVPAWSGNFNIINNLPAPTTFENQNAVPGDADVTPIAQGGWFFQVPHDSESTNVISFPTNTNFDNPDVTADPRFSINIACTAFSSPDNFKDLCIEFPDVNKFTTNGFAPNYTFSFQGNSNTLATLPVEIRILKYFGGTGVNPGASSDTAFGSGTETINTTNSIYNISGIFGNNTGQTIGTNNDDYIQIAIRFRNQLFNVTLSDFILTSGNIVLTGFPVTTNAEFLAPSTAGFLPTPNPDGSDLYLPIKLASEGFIFDTSEIGNIIAKTTRVDFPTGRYSVSSNEIACNGGQYSYVGYSSLGIPNYRLANKIFDTTSGCYIWGTGSNWINTYISTGDNTQLILVTNQTGSQTAPADSAGGTATGFTFVSNANPGASTHNYKTYSNATGFVTAISNFTNGTFGSAGAGTGTSGMTVTNYTDNSISNGYFIFTVQSLAASSLANGSSPGKYFTFSDHAINYYMWFFTAAETDPVADGTGIKCELTTTMTAADVGAVIAATLNGFQSNFITVTGQPTGGASSYFTFNSNGNPTAVWYQINGSGFAPAIASTVMVQLTGTESANQVAQLTQVAINTAFFVVPDLRGVTLRGYDPSNIWDVDIATRFSNNSMLAASSIGTLELSQITSHHHSASSITTVGGANAFASGLPPSQPGPYAAVAGWDGGPISQAPGTTTTTIGLAGGAESRPVNEYVFYAIKY